MFRGKSEPKGAASHSGRQRRPLEQQKGGKGGGERARKVTSKHKTASIFGIQWEKNTKCFERTRGLQQNVKQRTHP